MVIVVFYIIFFLRDATIPHTVLERVHLIGFDLTKQDIYQNVLSPSECFLKMFY